MDAKGLPFCSTWLFFRAIVNIIAVHALSATLLVCLLFLSCHYLAIHSPL